MASVMILLPPSEGKTSPTRGRPLDLASFRDQSLTRARLATLSALVDLCGGPADAARERLGLPESMAGWVADNARIRELPSAPAAAVYSGVLFTALGLPTLNGVDLRRANARIAVVSALFGMVRPTDRICAYRLSGGVDLPGVGPLTRFWREPLATAIPAAAGGGLVVDMRSAPYLSMWSPPRERPYGYLLVKVWQRGPAGQRTAVSHHNKSSKGMVARLLATAPRAARDPATAVEQVARAGWDVELDDAAGHPRLDVYLPG
jgi:hypothetical protein